MYVRDWMSQRLSGLPEKERRTVPAHASLWDTIPEHLVVRNLDLQDIEVVEGIYQTALWNMVKKLVGRDPLEAMRAAVTDVLCHHANPGSWYYTSVASEMLQYVHCEFTQKGVLHSSCLHMGMVGDVIRNSMPQPLAVQFINPAGDMVRDYVRKRESKSLTIRIPCHREDADIDYLRSPILNSVERRCGKCGRRWLFERSADDIIGGMGFDELRVTDNGWPLPELNLSLKL